VATGQLGDVILGESQLGEGLSGEKSGLGASNFTALGADEFIRTGAGMGVAALAASGEQEVTYAESGAGVAELSAQGGVDPEVMGTGVSEFTASGGDDATFAELGRAESSFTSSAGEELTLTEAGTGTAAFTAAGVKELLANREGSGVVPFTGGGATEGIETVANTAESDFTGSGIDRMTFVERTLNNPPIMPRTGGGSRESVSNKTGSGKAPFVGSGEKLHEISKSGTGTSPFTAASLPTQVGGEIVLSPDVLMGDVYPVFTFTGPCVDPFVDNSTTGEQLRLWNVTLGVNDVLVVDCAQRTVTLNNTSQSGFSGRFFPVTSPNTLAAGAASASTGFTATVEVPQFSLTRWYKSGNGAMVATGKGASA
jgi:hypothetical protein